MIPRLIFLCAVFVWVGQGETGAVEVRFTLERSGDLYTLDADRAPLAEILDEIDRHEPASLKLFGDVARTVSVTYYHQTLDQLLYRLGVSYVLVYAADNDGTYRLDDALVIDSDGAAASGIDPEMRRKVLAWIEAVRNDDIPLNALRAMWSFYEAGLDCAAVPLFESALFSHDYQQRQTVAEMVRTICPEEPSDQLLEVTLELLRGSGFDEYGFSDLFRPQGAYNYLATQTQAYQRVRGRLVHNLTSSDRQERLLSAILLAGHGEGLLASTLVPMLAPHLKDNDLPRDAAGAAYALYHLGPPALPYLARYEHSEDVQQAEMAALIVASIERGEALSAKKAEMFVSESDPLLVELPYLRPERWHPDSFPDEQGQYPDLYPVRRTARQIYSDDWPVPEYVVVPVEMDVVRPETSPVYHDDAPFPYTPRAGDTWELLVVKFSVSLESLLRHNGRSAADPLPEQVMVPWQ
jgi:hypothetical protein